MKCPKCDYNQSYKSGMQCQKCKYQFVLNPKNDLITDNQVISMLKKLSNNGHEYFTELQLTLMIAQAIDKKQASNLAGPIILAIITFILMFTPISDFFYLPQIGFTLAIALTLYQISQSNQKPLKPPVYISKIKSLINRIKTSTYLKDNNYFNYMIEEGKLEQNIDNAVIHDFAPEKIIIVDNNVTVDLLVYNQVHIKSKSAIVSIEGYPNQVYTATKSFIENQPDIPVYLFHDGSSQNRNYLGLFKSNSQWSHLHNNAQDLGITWSQLKNYTKTLPYIVEDKIYFTKFKSQLVNNQRAYLPIDFAQPTALITGLGVAIAAGGLTIAYIVEANDSSDGGDFG